MAALSIRSLAEEKRDGAAERLTALYNRALAGVHGFFPLAPGRLQHRVFASPWFDLDLLLLAYEEKRLVGFAHAALLCEPCYEEGGVIELVAVDPDARGRGVGRALVAEAVRRLDQRGARLIDGGGTFPFTPFYTTLIEGSERSGPETDRPGAAAVFTRNGFRPTRESLILRLDLSALPAPPPLPAGVTVRTSPREPELTWLDHVFRGWALTDSQLGLSRKGELLSRAIHAPMPELSAREGRRLSALFGVHTPPEQRRKGWAALHLRHLFHRLRNEGVEVVELHVYSDNEPAVRLYQGCGFRPVGRTVTLRRGGGG